MLRRGGLLAPYRSRSGVLRRPSGVLRSRSRGAPGWYAPG